MNAKELAQALGTREYPFYLPKDLAAQAKQHGLVVVYGASDDLMEFGGAVDDEIGCYDGDVAYLTPDGMLRNDCSDDGCPYFAKLKQQQAVTIEALWCKEGDYSWTYKTAIPHETFEIIADGTPYCRGIVFALADVPPPHQMPDATNGCVR